jgi:hypothetical protein
MRQELLTLLEHLDSPSVFGGTFVPNPFSFLCVLCCVLFVCVLCLVCPVLTVSLDCSFLISPSVFSNVYSIQYIP